MNRLEDSYLLWKSVCSCKLLIEAQLILCKFYFCRILLSQVALALVLNKCDLLQAKLQRGVRIRDSVPSYHNRANDLPTATRCEYVLLPVLIHYSCFPTLRLPTTL